MSPNLKLRSRARFIAAFTLVELAIVLVIIGLIIGGVLTAQQITQNARITSAIQGLKSVQAATQSYNQNYSALPGDDVQAKVRFPNAGIPDSPTPDNNGLIGGAFDRNTPAPDGESQLFWLHLRAAGSVKGSGAALPANPFVGGIYGVQDGAFGAAHFASGTNVVCLDKVPGNAAQAIDQQLDDGDPKTGNLRGGTGIAAVADNYVSNNSYVLCTPLQ